MHITPLFLYFCNAGLVFCNDIQERYGLMETEENRENTGSALEEEYIQRLEQGSVLLSREGLMDPNFQLTIIIICAYDKQGCFGLVCNRPSNMPLTEVFDLPVELGSKSRPIYIGGPVHQNEMFVLQLSEEEVEDSLEIQKGVYFGGNWESIEEIIDSDPYSTRLFLGYSGWAPGQLENEIREKAWEVYRVDIKKFLSDWKEPLFHDIEEMRSYLTSIQKKDEA